VNLRAAGAVVSALTLAACATPTYAPAPHAGPTPRPGPFPPEAQPQFATRIPLSELKGWGAEDHQAAFGAFRLTCRVARDAALARICAAAQRADIESDGAARRFFEANFEAEPQGPAGVLTAYFAPEYPARRTADDEFSMPVRPKPADLDPSQPYADRTEIEARPANDALAWMRPEDLFFLQVQGSGVLTFEDGKRMKALYAANNGRPFVPIAGPMRQQGLLKADNTSGEAIRGWLAAHRGPDAQAIMQLNPRYAFFRLAPDDGKQPAGAAGLPLPPGRAVAVDTLYHAMGELLWIDADAPVLTGAFPSYRRMVTALDVGGAIKGKVRADLYMGLGPAAGAEAGRVRHTLRLFKLVPRP
jgi:membrane-bound lytic murein transglycosylase A